MLEILHIPSCHGSLNYILIYVHSYILSRTCLSYENKDVSVQLDAPEGPKQSSIISFSHCAPNTSSVSSSTGRPFACDPSSPLHLLVPVAPPCQGRSSLERPQGLSNLWSQASCGPPGQWLSSVCNRRLPSDASSPEQAPFSPRGKQEESLQDNMMSHHN